REGRIPGKLNICTMWDPEPFLALCDYQTGVVPGTGVSSYQQAQLFNLANPLDPTTLYGAMIKSRTPGDAASGIPMGTPSKNDQPFKSLATGVVAPGSVQYPAGSGIDDTFLRGAGDPVDPTRRLFDVTPMSRPPAPGVPAPLDHPYLKSELINKIFNNVTT